MSNRRKRYTRAEKLEIVKLTLDTNQNIREISERFGINISTIYTWRSEYLKVSDWVLNLL